jgi:acyl-CoA thioester hydrolase
MIDETTISVQVRYAECDAQRVAHHSTYPIWLEMARTELLRVNGMSYRDCEDIGAFFVVVSLGLKYRKPAIYDEVITVRVWHTSVGRVKIDHAYEVKRGEELLVSATSTLACVDRNGRPRGVPDALFGE